MTKQEILKSNLLSLQKELSELQRLIESCVDNYNTDHYSFITNLAKAVGKSEFANKFINLIIENDQNGE